MNCQTSKINNQTKTADTTFNKVSEEEFVKQIYPSSDKPLYLSFLRFFGIVNFFIGGIALIAVVFIFATARRSDSNTTSLIIAVAIAIESFLVFGVLMALADIAENMIEVGKYVKNLKNK